MESFDSGGVVNSMCSPLQNLAEDPKVIFLQALPNSVVNGADVEGQQKYQLVYATPVQRNPVSVTASDSLTSTIIPVKLEIGFEKRVPAGNVPGKIWVPEKEKSKQKTEDYLGRGVKTLTKDAGATLMSNAAKVTNFRTVRQLRVCKKNEESSLSQESSSDALGYRLKNFIQIHDKPAQPRALAVLPYELQYQRGLVSPRRAMPACVQFGPVQGINESITMVEAKQLVGVMVDTPLFLVTCDYNSVIHINVRDPDKSNWMGLLPLGDEKTANVWIHQHDNELYGVTIKPIAASTPLRLGYSTGYAAKYGIIGQPTIDLLAELTNVQPSHSCKECGRMFSTKRYLELHRASNHSQKAPGAYRCKLCSMRFTRKFALKRHQRLTCTKTKENATNTYSPTKQPNPEIQNGDFSQQNGADDSNRLPSDESLQNYTNILDISTNLFDTDRMPNLDISGSVKSDNEFNPLGFKDDSHLANDFSFANGLMDDLVVGDAPNVKKSSRKVRSSSPFACPYCKCSMPRSKLKQHSKYCMAQRFFCVCGRKYRMKAKMEAHIRVCDVVKNSKVLDNPYSCAECNLTFKRRGMYVNHLTTRHSGSAAVPEPPLVVPDRRYPCPECSKFYKTQAKRHAHVLSQHPGLKYDHTKAVVCGSMARQPAKCWACPRQYVTRAKLLQHARAHHPNSEPPAPYNVSPSKQAS